MKDIKRMTSVLKSIDKENPKKSETFKKIFKFRSSKKSKNDIIKILKDQKIRENHIISKIGFFDKTLDVIYSDDFRKQIDIVKMAIYNEYPLLQKVDVQSVTSKTDIKELYETLKEIDDIEKTFVVEDIDEDYQIEIIHSEDVIRKTFLLNVFESKIPRYIGFLKAKNKKEYLNKNEWKNLSSVCDDMGYTEDELIELSNNIPSKKETEKKLKQVVENVKKIKKMLKTNLKKLDRLKKKEEKIYKRGKRK